ncbi:MAG: flagellar basal body P-ring protein FlgI [Planctomycetota bacterium]
MIHLFKTLVVLMTVVCAGQFSNAQFQNVPGAQPLQSPNQITNNRITPLLDAPTSPFSTPPGMTVDRAVRVKDVTSIEGHRTNTVTGVGVVTGLKGTGGKSQLTRDAVANVVRRFNILTEEMPTGSASLVAVTAEIPPFVRAGETIRANVSTIDDASGLFGGVLLLTELKAVDGRVYAVAGGQVLLSGFSASGESASVSKNHDTTGNVKAQIEVELDNEPAFPNDRYRLLLVNKDYATAFRIAEEINRVFPGAATAEDQGSVSVTFPAKYRRDKLEFVVQVNNLRVLPDAPARVVINQKTGTVVVGANVKLSKVMFANENLIISTSESPLVSQPAPFSQGQTQVVPRTNITATETGGRYSVIDTQPTVGDLATLLNSLGVSPRDMISIFQDIQASGALQAKLIIN